MEEWRIYFYPLGFLSGIAFGLRFLVQWIESERAKKSVVPAAFWKISLVGNILLVLHSFIQMQYHVYLIQALSSVIAWRNLNLMQKNKPPISLKNVFVLLAIVFFTATLAFQIQGLLLGENNQWFRVPTAPWQSSPNTSVSILWHMIGTLGYFLFSGRFWVQWWLSEKSQTSRLPAIFWQLSLSGALLSIAYFAKINDMVNLIGPLVGIIPYMRNLILIKKDDKIKSKEA